jgi:hypothetical protein
MALSKPQRERLDYPWALECWREMMVKYTAGRQSEKQPHISDADSALDEAANYHRLAMNKADEADRLREALRPFARIEAANGDDFSTYPDETVIRCEVTAGEIRRAREAMLPDLRQDHISSEDL